MTNKTNLNILKKKCKNIGCFLEPINFILKKEEVSIKI